MTFFIFFFYLMIKTVLISSFSFTSKELYDYLVQHYLKYQYSHDWKAGDLMLFDQTQAMHKRQPFPTKENGEQQDRLLWRGIFYYEGVQ